MADLIGVASDKPLDARRHLRCDDIYAAEPHDTSPYVFDDVVFEQWLVGISAEIN